MSFHARVERLESRVLLSGSVVAHLPDKTHLVEAGASLTRLYADGSVDLAFGTAGTATIPLQGAQLGPVALQPDGKILAGGDVSSGTKMLLLARFNNDGTLDGSFGPGGIVLASAPQRSDDQCSQIVVQPDGKIVAVGLAYNGFGDPGEVQFLPFILRYDTIGTLDPSFGSNGTVLMGVHGAIASSINAVKLKRDGSFVVTLTGNINDTDGSVRVVQRLDADGNPEASSRVKPPPTPADVVPLSFSLSRLPAAVTPGALGVAVIRLRNEGGTSANGQVQFTLYAANPSAGTSISGATAVAAFSRPLRLPAGKSRSVRVRFTFSQPLATGTYQFLATTSGAGILGSPAIAGPILTV